MMIVMKYYIIIILFSIILETLTTTISTRKRIEGAIILDHTQVHETHSHHGKRKFLHAQEFIANVFNLDIRVTLPSFNKYNQSNDPHIFKVQQWPSLFTGNCPEIDPTLRPGKKPGMDRAMLIVHRECWDQFARRRKINTERQHFSEKDDVLIIFEDDVIALFPNANEIMVQEINRSDADILYLGWCYWTNTKFPPLCMQSYAVTSIGAKKLVDIIDPCGYLPLDEQIQKAGRENLITWNLTIVDEDIHYVKDHLQSQGALIPPILSYKHTYGGLYTQAEYDDYIDISLFKENETLIKGSSRSIYLWANHSLHEFPDIGTFMAYGFEFGQEKTISDWQLRQLPFGDQLPSVN